VRKALLVVGCSLLECERERLIGERKRRRSWMKESEEKNRKL
jgi:hypothetical protein